MKERKKERKVKRVEIETEHIQMIMADVTNAGENTGINWVWVWVMNGPIE